MVSPRNWFSQIGSITKLTLQTLPERKGSAIAAAFGIAAVVAVLTGVLSIAQGFRHTMTSAAAPDRVLVLRSGSDSEMMSILGGEEVKMIADTAGIARSPEGPIASAELFVVINLPKRSSGTDANVPLRGVSPAAFPVRDELHRPRISRP